MAENRHRLSPFSVILIMVALMIMGAGMIPLLSVQLQPGHKTQNLSVLCSWSGASPAVMENEVISKLEGVLAQIDGVESISSTSNLGNGQVTLTFKEGTKMNVARFEAASRIRFLYPKLPEGVSYPYLSLSTGGDSGSGSILVAGYTINSGLSAQETERYITENILPPLSRIADVNRVSYGGILPYEYEITVDPDAAVSAGVTISQVASAFNNYFAETTIGNVTYGGDGNVILLKARMSPPTLDFSSIPIANANGRIIYIGDLATVSYRQTLPSSYSRINGLGTVNLSVSGAKGCNVVKVSAEVKAIMAELEKSFPANFRAEMNYDAADHINKELRTIFMRTLMTVVILMLFVLAVSRNWRYLLMIFVTLAANILVAIIFYYLLGLQIHIYSLAGITVSLGIIIDTSIIMIDHYSYYRDRKAFLAILAAVLTSIATMAVVFLLPAQQKLVFGDFALVIMLNLAVSLLISLFFIPALLDRFPLRKPMTAVSVRIKRLVARFNRVYSRFIGWGRRHRWIFIVILVLGFGIPVHMLPAKLEPKKGEEPTEWMKLYNKTIGSKFYRENKGIFEKTLGGSFRLFDTYKPSGGNVNREPERIALTIRAGMVEGNTVHQLNEIVRHMENYLSRFDEIESFRTTVSSYDNSMITVTFKPEYEKGSFPYILFENAKREVNRFGGATWSIYGLPEMQFSNNIVSSNQYKPHRIVLTGYNYETLLAFAEGLRDSLAQNRRVSEPGIYGEVSWGAARPRQEYLIDIDREKVMMSGVNLSAYFGQLSQLLYNSSLRSVFVDGESKRVSLSSSQKNSFDLWHVKNYPLQVDTVKAKLFDFGTIERQYSGLSIYRNNQSYQLIVAFDFIGSWELSNRLKSTQIKRMNDDVLPIGYMAKEDESRGWWDGGGAGKGSFLLILLVIAIIYVICTILFESLRKPLVIILMIPVSFIGVFLTFGLFGFRFDQGGFASFILLSGLVINAGIYVVNEYNIISRKYPRKEPLDMYITAYSRKIIPISLTIISTILGMLPFIVGGRDLVFWYTFAIGTIGGMVFSIIAFIIYLPIFMPLKKN